MYLAKKYWGKKAVQMQAYIAPDSFDANAQELNIISVYNSEADADKAYIFSVTSAITNMTLPTLTCCTYKWGETIGGVDYSYYVNSGVAFTSGSTKRYVLVLSSLTTLAADATKLSGFIGAVWLYCGKKVYSVKATASSYLKYVHHEDLSKITEVYESAFYDYSGLIVEGVVTISNSVIAIQQKAFYNAKKITKINIGSGVTSVAADAFRNCTGVLLVNIYAKAAPTTSTYPFLLQRAPVPLHVPVGATGYNVAPWTNTTIFSSIIYDL